MKLNHIKALRFEAREAAEKAKSENATREICGWCKKKIRGPNHRKGCTPKK